MKKLEATTTTLGSDNPQVDPAQDAFGYAPFARRIAEAVRDTPSPHGLVIAIQGPWGSGKSSFLNFVTHFLKEMPGAKQPMVIEFNPWWFNDRTQLANQFLAQFRSNLKHESEALRTVGDSIARYSDALGKMMAVGFGIPWIDTPIQFVLGLFARKAKDIPKLKSDISKALTKAGRRIVFVIDDIDRLAPEEMREIFKVIKALADFPNVVYLLAFDRKIVADALRATLGIDGEGYLEKIVQAPFSLPSIDPLRIRRKLFAELDQLLGAIPSKQFDSTYWGNVFFDGLSHFIVTPRDVVRVVNTLAVTYPAVAGEVNTVDFIALEFLRVFEPSAYDFVRNNPDMFTGASATASHDEKEVTRSLHENWLKALPESRQKPVRELLIRIFPRLEAIWRRMNYGSDHLPEWRRQLRACHPDVFDVYFQFGVSPDVLSRAELDDLIRVAANPEETAAIFRAASRVVRDDGSSKARDYLERLGDMTDEFPADAATGLLTAIVSIGDEILVPGDEGGSALFSVPNRWRLRWAVAHLVDAIPEVDRPAILETLVSTGTGLSLIVEIVDSINEYLSKPTDERPSWLGGIDAEAADKLKRIVIHRLDQVAVESLLDLPHLGFVLHTWVRWVDPAVLREHLRPLFDSDAILPRTLEAFVQFGTSYAGGDRVTRRTLLLDPKAIEPFTDIISLEPRVGLMLDRCDLTAGQRAAAEKYLVNMNRIRQDKSSDG